MGPSLVSDGNPISATSSFTGYTKASMGPSLVSDGNVVDGIASDIRCEVLQWGRRWSATETVRAVDWDVPAGLASMGPSLVSDGNRLGQVVISVNVTCFNGAVAGQRRKHPNVLSKLEPTTALQWGRRWSATETAYAYGMPKAGLDASMGPSLVSDGNNRERPAGTPTTDWLQWGRRWSATETPRGGNPVKLDT